MLRTPSLPTKRLTAPCCRVIWLSYSSSLMCRMRFSTCLHRWPCHSASLMGLFRRRLISNQSPRIIKIYPCLSLRLTSNSSRLRWQLSRCNKRSYTTRYRGPRSVCTSSRPAFNLTNTAIKARIFDQIKYATLMKLIVDTLN